VALTSAAATSPGYEEYIATASSSYNNASNYDAWAAFNGNVEEGTQEGWLSISGSYDNATPSLPVTSGSNAELFNSRYGDWLNIKLPNKIVLSKLHTYPRTGNENPGVVRDYEHPDAGYLYGSNDGFSTFQEIYSFDGVPVSTTFRVPTIHTVNATKAYNEYRFQVTKLKGQRSFTAISEMELFGTPEYDPEAHGTDVTIKSYPNVPNTDWLEVYYDAKDLTTMPSIVTDLAGGDQNGTVTGHSPTLDTTDGIESFKFDGTDDYITSTLTGLSSTQYTMAGWIKIDTLDSTVNTFFSLGDWASGNGRAVGIAIDSSNRIGANVKGVADATFSEVTVGKWYHVVADFTSNGDTHLYVNGNLVDTVAGTTFAIPTNPPLFIGSRANASGTVETARLFPGSIANFRLYNRALTSDEIYQLYAYQKEDFGHGDLSMTLKAGRLGIGTSEPRAALDVKGDMILNDIPFGNMRPFFYTTGSDGGDILSRSTTDLTNNTNTRIVVPYVKTDQPGFDTDPTNSFDNTTHAYTIPTSGLWYFNVSGMVRSQSSGNHYAVFYIKVNNSERTRNFMRLEPNNIEIQSFHQHVTFCNAGDIIQVTLFLLSSVTNIDVYVNRLYGSFFGFMLP
tara:strand:- start:451 stop:2310 length:1860 start_codon:yes stop_codon:yes gene_type:complete